MPFGIESDHFTVGFGLFVGLPEIVQSGEILQARERPRIERYALAFLRCVISTSRIETPVHAATVFKERDHLVYLATDHGIITKVKAAQAGGHVESARGIEFFYSDLEVGFVPGGIYSHAIAHQGLERVGTAAHI